MKFSHFDEIRHISQSSKKMKQLELDATSICFSRKFFEKYFKEIHLPKFSFSS